MIIVSTKTASELGLIPFVRIRAYASAGVEPLEMGLGPIPAVRKVLEKAELTTRDIHLFELNEAFAAQALAVQSELMLDPSQVNVNGRANALGHPIGASGARVLTTLIHAMKHAGRTSDLQRFAVVVARVSP